jgi:hypothetical protein
LQDFTEIIVPSPVDVSLECDKKSFHPISQIPYKHLTEVILINPFDLSIDDEEESIDLVNE